uniref:Uncharacterized protein n=1 Tax=Quercus lobata TaxID=97700 RepID=A0A7N2LNV3_QUELO
MAKGYASFVTHSQLNCFEDFRKDWLMILMIVTSSRSDINIRRLEKATGSTGKQGLLSEGNAAYNWSRCVDELESQLSKHGSLKKLYFYHQHLTATQGMRRDVFPYKGMVSALTRIAHEEGIRELHRPWHAHMHAPKFMKTAIGKQPWQRYTAKIKIAPMGKAATAKACSQSQGISHRQAAKAKVAPVGKLPRPRHVGLPK